MFAPSVIIEAVAAGASLLYIVLLIRERVACWPFGIAGSMLSIWLFIDTRLYAEAILYTFYVGMGIWGWARWSVRAKSGSHPVVRLSTYGHMALLAICLLFGTALGHALEAFSEAERPLIDAMTTSFSFAATYLEVRKTLDTWLYWLAINLVTIWLYQDRSLDIYALLMVVYAVLSVLGFVRWMRTYKQQFSRPGVVTVRTAPDRDIRSG